MGWPVAHSRSPRLHNFWLDHYQIDGVYVPLPVQPEHLAQALRALPVLGVRGVNLTIPHKEAALRIVDHVAEDARRVGAVNTVVVRADGTLEGRNTDGFGFAENLRRGGCDGGAGAALVLGAGGAARAVMLALREKNCPKIYLSNRTRERAESLARDFGTIEVVDWERKEDVLADVALLVNATSLGMSGQPALDMDLARLAVGATVTDIVYTPLMTPLLDQAARRGARVIDGLGMLLHQARAGFAAWFGTDPDVTEELRAHVLESLA